jgi:hypothetical protein
MAKSARRGWKAAPTEKDLTHLEVSGFLTHQIQSCNGAIKETSVEGLNESGQVGNALVWK